MKGFIYILVDPIANLVRYVGQTDDPKKRLSHHWRDRQQKKNKKNHKAHWINKLWRDHGARPEMKIIEELEGCCVEELESILNERELYWIQHYLNRGCDLTNTSHKFYNRIINHHKINKKSGHARAVFVYSQSGIESKFDSHRDASRSLHISHKAIGKVVNSIKQWGFCAGYLISSTTLTNDDVALRYSNRIKFGHAIIAIKISTKEKYKFNSQQEAAEKLGITFKNVNSGLRRAKTSLGYKWFYAEDELKAQEFINEITAEKFAGAVQLYESGMYIKEIAAKYNVCHSTMSVYLKKNGCIMKIIPWNHPSKTKLPAL